MITGFTHRSSRSAFKSDVLIFLVLFYPRLRWTLVPVSQGKQAHLRLHPYARARSGSFKMQSRIKRVTEDDKLDLCRCIAAPAGTKLGPSSVPLHSAPLAVLLPPFHANPYQVALPSNTVFQFPPQYDHIYSFTRVGQFEVEDKGHPVTSPGDPPGSDLLHQSVMRSFFCTWRNAKFFNVLFPHRKKNTGGLVRLCDEDSRPGTKKTPDTTTRIFKLRSTGTAHHFSFLLNSTDYRILRMDEDHDRMYVGSKDYILSLDLHDINKEPLIIHWPVSQQRKNECILSGKDTNGECGNFIRVIEPWNRTHLYICGTGAYNPVCTYVNRGRKAQGSLHQQMPQSGGRASRAADFGTTAEPPGPKEYIFHLEPGKVDSGKGKCSYDPKLNSVSALINGELYAGVYIDFMGTDSAIFRTLGQQTAMRTDQYNSRWLNDPSFVHVHLIPDSAERNDDKLYFFFREKSSEMGQSPVSQSRIGRICLNDDGGHCCLVNKWSTFLKARLICSVPGSDGVETHFDELRESPSLPTPLPSSVVIPQRAVRKGTQAEGGKRSERLANESLMKDLVYCAARNRLSRRAGSGVKAERRSGPEYVGLTRQLAGGAWPLLEMVGRVTVMLTVMSGARPRQLNTCAVECGVAANFTEVCFAGDVYIQQTQDTKNPVIYGVFSVSGSVFKGSAVCVYSMADIRMVFNGPFAHKEGPNYQWVAYAGKIPYPRPGTCPGGTFTPNMKSTKDYPDEVINFMRNHPTMYNAVYPVHKRPLVVRTNVDYEFTTITVDQVTAADGSYEVLFLGTDRGTVQKVIVLPTDDLQTEELVLEEVEVFRVTRISEVLILPSHKPGPPVTGRNKFLRLAATATEFSTFRRLVSFSPPQQQLYVASAEGVTHLTLHRCDVYGEACADCCLARDPYCAWDGKSCSRYSASQKRRSRRQDVKYGNPIRQCRGYNSNGTPPSFINTSTSIGWTRHILYLLCTSSDFNRNNLCHGALFVVANKNTLEMVQYGVEGSSTFLECQARSPHACIRWHVQKENSDRKKEMKTDGRVLKTEQGLLLRSLQPSDSGTYHCTATEKNFKHALLKLQLVVLSSRAVHSALGDSAGPSAVAAPLQAGPWTPNAGQYKDLLTLLSQPEMGLINQYCQDYWPLGSAGSKEPVVAAVRGKDLKELKEQKKPRNRRNHDGRIEARET
ncbi:semaphorin-3F-like [Scleropages formosus]|uniref:Semaphorin-3F-like n=1 Tax=Scleropages formosus TaxID=113540 RepID=A0A0P7XC66_SCLFO|nr:semaphorin-3F-like [Scleropages formosus]